MHVLRRREEERRVLLVMQVRVRMEWESGTWRGNIPRHSHIAPFHSHPPSYSPASQSHAASHVCEVQKVAGKSRTSITPCPSPTHTSIARLKRERGGADPEECKGDRVWERETGEGLGDC